jgi:hypothetical protein
MPLSKVPSRVVQGPLDHCRQQLALCRQRRVRVWVWRRRRLDANLQVEVRNVWPISWQNHATVEQGKTIGCHWQRDVAEDEAATLRIGAVCTLNQ